MRRIKKTVIAVAAAAVTAVLVMAPCAAAIGAETGNTAATRGEAVSVPETVPAQTDTETADPERPEGEDDAAAAGTGEKAASEEPAGNEENAAAAETAPAREPGSEDKDDEGYDPDEAGDGETKGNATTSAAAAAEVPSEQDLEENSDSVKPAETQTSESEEAAFESGEEPVTKRNEKNADIKSGESAAPEPDWLTGGNGNRKDITDTIDIKFVGMKKISYYSYGLGRWVTQCGEILIDGTETDERAICLDPLLSISGVVGSNSDRVYEYSTPMLVKAVYYGVGPGRDVLQNLIKDMLGSEINYSAVSQIVTHIAASQIFARLHESDPDMGTPKSKYGDGFRMTEAKLVELVNRYGNAIGPMAVPDNYYVYVAAFDDDMTQDFGIGAYRLTPPPEGHLKLTKSPGKKELTDNNGCYSLKGAEYGVYSDRECTQPVGTLVTDEDGVTNTLVLPGESTYYVKEIRAPLGYCLDSKIREVAVGDDGQEYTVEVSDVPASSGVRIVIRKKSSSGGEADTGSLAGTEFTIRYFDGYYDAEDLPEEPYREWVISAEETPEGCLAQMAEENKVRGTFYNDEGKVVMPLGTFTIRETKAADGYLCDGEFGEGTAVYIGQVRMNGDGSGAKIVTVQGTPSLQNENALEFEVTDTPLVPELGTCAADKETGEHIAAADGTVVIEDTVSYKDLNAGSEYIMSGRLMDAGTGTPVKDAEGKEVTSSRRFTADPTGSGSIVMTFSFEAGSSFEGKTLVVFERAVLAETGSTAAVHENIEDEGQSIHFPAGKTTAMDSETLGHTSCADESVTITDTIEYKNLIPGLSYRAEGILMDAETGEPIRTGGGRVSAKTDFTPQSADGTVTVTFEFDGAALSGKRAVVFEKVKYSEKTVFVHEDLSDEGQTILFASVKTSAKDQTSGDKTILPVKDASLRDTVSFKNLSAGREYIVKGTLVDKKTAEPVSAGGNAVTALTRFTAVSADGTVGVDFNFDATGLEKGDYVVFEDLYEVNPDSGKASLIASHRDLGDKEQTLSAKGPGKPGDTTDTGDHNDAAALSFLILLCAALAAALAMPGQGSGH